MTSGGPTPPSRVGAVSLLLQTPRARIARLTRRLTGAESPLYGATVMVTGASPGIGEAIFDTPSP